MKQWPFLILCLMVNCAKASMEEAHQQGAAFGESLNSSAFQNTQTKIDKDQVPGFETANPSEAQLSKQGDFREPIQSALKSSEAGQMLFESSEKRPRYKLDPKTDPLFLKPDHKILEKALDMREADIKLEKEAPVRLTCEEGGEEITHQCVQNRQVIPQVPIKTINLTVNHLNFQKNMESYRVQTRKGRWNRHGKWEDRQRQNGWKLSLPKEIEAFRRVFCPKFNPLDTHGRSLNLDCSRIQSFKINNASSVSESNGMLTILTPGKSLNISLLHDTYEGEETDQWVSYCDSLEEMVNQGLCRYAEKSCSQGPATRLINGYQIYKDCWQLQQKYHCKLIKDECSPLKTQGCYQIASHCKEEKQGRCWIFEQTYECPSQKIQKTTAETSNLFCLTGNCQDSSYSANKEILDVVSRLAMLKEVQDDIRTQQSLDSFEIFKGSQQHCTRNCVDFKDCCGGMKGWGVSSHLASCTESEKQLAKMREKSLCRLIGTYCAERVLGVCTRKKTVFCCFGTRFSRLLQEQGRPQLGLDWGSSETPNCRGFTVEELSKIDFSKLDLRELFVEMMQKYRAPNMEAIQRKTAEQLQQNMKALELREGGKSIPPTGVLLDKDKSL